MFDLKISPGFNLIGQEVTMYKEIRLSSDQLAEGGFDPWEKGCVRIGIPDQKTSHFSVVLDTEDVGGAAHDLILLMMPDLKPLVDLHLCNADGVPMHCVENGIYFVVGKTRHSHVYAYTWENSNNTRDGLEVAASHFRVSIEEINVLIEKINACEAEANEIRNVVVEFVEDLKPRWKDEAERAISYFNSL
jgi:hypothetical protein